MRGLVPLLLGVLLAGCAPENFELNTAMREGRSYKRRYPHPVFPADSSGLDSLTARLRQAWNAHEALLSGAETEQLRVVGDTLALEAWLESFWLRRDPLPTTVRNERRGEHLRRLALALRDYASPAPPYYDARGRALIQMGEPDAKLAAEADISQGGYTPPLELWRVDSMLIAFQSFANSGVFAPSGMPLEQEGLFVALAGGTRDVFMMLENHELAVDAGRVERYRYLPRGPRLATAFSPDCYRAADGGSLLRLYYAQDGKALGRVPASAEQGGGWRLREGLALRDAEGAAVLDSERTFMLQPPAWPRSGRITGLLEKAVPPGDYTLTFHLRDLAGGGESIQQQELRVPLFPPATLAISDISFFEASPDLPGATVLGAPHPSGRIGRGKPLGLRCEIYGLALDAVGRGVFTVRYSIAGRGRSGASTSFRRDVSGESGRIELVLDTTGLPAGDYQLSITVIDRVREIREPQPELARVEQQRPFTILDRRKRGRTPVE